MSFYSDVLFPWGYDWMMKDDNLDAKRGERLADVRGRILEVGIGTGLNLPFYPEHVERITAIDPNPGMAKELEKRLENSRVDVEFVSAPAESLPFADDTFDTVVSCHVLCSVQDVGAALSEIKRVLKPGGRLLFLEHGESPDECVCRWQHRLNWVQQNFAAGCRLELAVEAVLENAGFEIAELQTGYLEGQPKTHGYLFDGIATPVC